MEEKSAIEPKKPFLDLLNWSCAGIILHPKNLMRKVSLLLFSSSRTEEKCGKSKGIYNLTRIKYIRSLHSYAEHS